MLPNRLTFCRRQGGKGLGLHDDRADQAVVLNGTQLSFPADLNLSISKGPGASQSGIYDLITFTLKVENSGPVTASNVRVCSLLPAGISYGDSEASAAALDAATSTWTIGHLASGGQEIL